MTAGCFFCSKAIVSKVKTSDQIALYRCSDADAAEWGRVVAVNKPREPQAGVVDHISDCKQYRGMWGE